MKRYKIVYGVYDLTHWNAIIPCSYGGRIHVEFKGGSATNNGTKPATFATTNPAYQAMIESSDFFKRGKIVVYRKYEIQEATTPVKSPKVVDKKNETPKKEEVKGNVGEVKETAESATPKEEVKTDANGYTLVEVSDIERDGRQYLCDNFGCKAESLRTKAIINATAAKHKIKFVLPTE